MSPAMTIAALEQAMTARGLLGADTKPLAAVPIDRPWFITAVVGGAGWLAGIFALVFVGLLFTPDDAGEFALIGALMVGAAYALYAIDRDSAFLDQLALALSIAGQLALIAAAAEATESAAMVAAITAAMECVVLVAMPNRFAKVLAAFFGCVAWSLAIRLAWWDEWDFGGETRSVALVPALAGWLIIWVPVAAGVHALVVREAAWMASRWRGVARPASSGLLAALSVATMASEPVAAFTLWNTGGAQPTNWLVLWPLFAVMAALFAAVCAFRLRNFALVGVAIAGALLHVGHFYYLLGASLLVKSVIMVLVGGVLLAASFSSWPAAEKEGAR